MLAVHCCSMLTYGAKYLFKTKTKTFVKVNLRPQKNVIKINEIIFVEKGLFYKQDGDFVCN